MHQKNFFAALVFVIDSSCPSRFLEAQSELVRILAERDLVDASFLIILNRRRIPGNESCEIDSAAIDQLVMNINRFSNGLFSYFTFLNFFSLFLAREVGDWFNVPRH